MGLLRALGRAAGPLGLTLSVAHLDHGVRGEAARADTAFVADLADSLSLPLDLGQWRPTRPGHFESDARRARYAWLTDVARARNAAVVAVGHTRDDQAETILHRILRGTGPRGLEGIRARRILATNPELMLVRPLLGVSRRAVRRFLSTIGQPFREDVTNADLTRTRGRIRNDLLPKLAAEYNPQVDRALVRLGALTGSLERRIDRHVESIVRDSTISVAENAVVLKHGFLNSTSRSLLTEVLRRVWKNAQWPEASMSARRWRRLAALIRKREIRPVVIGARVEVSSDGLFVVLRRIPASAGPRAAAETPHPIALALPGLTDVPWATCGIDARADQGRKTDRDEVVDFDQVAGPLFVRAPMAGDRFDPLGMGGKRMVLADFFRGRRVPPDQRVNTPLVCDGVGIVWVAGHRIAERVKETSQTKRRLTLRLEPPVRAEKTEDGLQNTTGALMGERGTN